MTPPPTPMLDEVAESAVALAVAEPGGRTRRDRWVTWGLILLVPVGGLFLWWLITRYEWVHPVLMPPLPEVYDGFVSVVTAEGFGGHLWRTVSSIIAGYVLGAGFGFALGVWLAAVPWLRRAYFPLIAGFEAVPGIILAPIIITWLGFGINSKIAQGAIACFFPVFLTTLVGLALASDNELKLMRSLRASRWQIFYRLRLPTALPAIFGGLKIAMTTATIAVVVSEFVGADSGLGYQMLRYKSAFRVPEVWGLIIVFAVIGAGSFLLLEWLERKVVWWRT